jgi:chemotaxis response regulator CheB
VKVNGEVLEVSLKELKAGYQRQADYTREKQALKKQIEEFEEVSGNLIEAYEGLQSLEQAWEENPITVLSQFFSTTENPTYAMALTIKELAVANLLDQDFLDMFGVTSEVKRQWSQETQSTRVQQEQKATGSRREQELAAAQEELEIQKAIAEYDRQIDEILDAEGLDFTVKQRTAFRKELATYAAENELTNLKAAYKAFKYEETQTKKKAAAKTAAKAKDKKAASVVARSGSGADGASSVKDSSDLTSVIKAAMQDTQANLAK